MSKSINAPLAFDTNGAQYPRRLTAVRRLPDAYIIREGRRLVDFTSNDYLSLSFNREIQQAFCDGVMDYGVGSGGSPLISGFDEQKAMLQTQFANYLGFDACLFLSNGYMANLAALSVLDVNNTDVFIDKYSHASIYDSLRLNGLRFKRYHHLDMPHLEQQLAASKSLCKLIISDGLFSMTGQVAPLADLVRLKKRYNALLLIDDAHAIGVLGDKGRGSAASFADDIDVLVCPMGKAFSASGATICANESTINAIIQSARAYCYNTALPAALASALVKTLAIIKAADDRRAKLNANIRLFKVATAPIRGCFHDANHAIQYLKTGTQENAKEISEALYQSGYHSYMIRPPTVPKKQIGIRFVITAGHLEADLVDLGERLCQLVGQLIT